MNPENEVNIVPEAIDPSLSEAERGRKFLNRVLLSVKSAQGALERFDRDPNQDLKKASNVLGEVGVYLRKMEMNFEQSYPELFE